MVFRQGQIRRIGRLIETGITGRPVSSGVQVPGEPGHCCARTRHPWWTTRRVFWHLFVYGLLHYRMTLRTVPSDREVRNRSTAFRVDLGTRYVTICVVSRFLKEGVGERAIRWGAWSADCGRGGVGKQWREKKAFSSIFTTDTKSFIHVTRIAAMHIIFKSIGCTLFTCDVYMCRLRHINDPVFSSLKM
jgi:hypothetical protein